MTAGSMKFTHHPRNRNGADAEWLFDPSRTYEQNEPWCKPRGFWLSVDDDWRRWCEAEDFDVCDLELEFPFDVDISRLFVISDVEGIDQFDELYVKKATPFRVTSYDDGHDRYRIDWGPLASEFAGIMIAPYIWQRRLHSPASTWYYSWDCASACVWDLTAINPMPHQQGEPSP